MAWHKISENWLVTNETGGRLKQSLILNRWSMHTYDIIHGDMQHFIACISDIFLCVMVLEIIARSGDVKY